jgi:hypothetical protein
MSPIFDRRPARRGIAALATLVLVAGAGPAAALSFENSPRPAVSEPPLGVTSWNVLGKAAVIYGEANGEETVTTIIPPEIESLDGTPVTRWAICYRSKPGPRCAASS